jgi:hypothetical protein
VWRSTTHVGLAASECGSYLFANYAPAGNMMGDFGENVLEEGAGEGVGAAAAGAIGDEGGAAEAETAAEDVNTQQGEAQVVEHEEHQREGGVGGQQGEAQPAQPAQDRKVEGGREDEAGAQEEAAMEPKEQHGGGRGDWEEKREEPGSGDAEEGGTGEGDALKQRPSYLLSGNRSSSTSCMNVDSPQRQRPSMLHLRASSISQLDLDEPASPRTPLSPMESIMKLQAGARRLKARRSLVRLMQREGTMLAMNGTVQGASGWYELEVQDREGWYAVKYEVDADENWTCVKGPLPEVEYLLDTARDSFRAAVKDSGSSIGAERRLRGRVEEMQKAQPLLEEMINLDNSTEMLELLTGHLRTLLDEAKAQSKAITKQSERLISASRLRMECEQKQKAVEASHMYVLPFKDHRSQHNSAPFNPI